MECEWRSKRINFSRPNKKTLTALSVQTENEIIVSIFGDFGKKEVGFPKGYTKKKLNLSSDDFELSITSSEQMDIKKILLNYSLKGGK